MRVLTKEEVEQEKLVLSEAIWNGAVFIHPTDTIYGVGCNALLSKSVQKIRMAKKRYESPFSVIAPSREWIHENCLVNEEANKWVNKLPGPYTLILQLKNKDCIAPDVNNNMPTLGVRMPDHWFSSAVKELAFPIVTTSANVAGGNFMTDLDNLDQKIKNEVEFIIYEGEKHGKPSKIIDLTKETRIIER